MNYRRSTVISLILGVLGVWGAAASAAAPPRLVVLISIDQFRPDYLTRFADLYLPAGNAQNPGGFRYLMERGAWYPDCQYQQARTVTGVGHAVLGTGAQPHVSGIIGNDWWDRASGKRMYCVAATRATGVPASAPAMSPENLLVTTIGDELEKATGGAARTVSIALKDRASILMGGRLVDACIWFNDRSGEWVSSSAYTLAGQLPPWVTELNTRRLAEELRKEPWAPVVNADALQRVWKPGGRVPFRHTLTGDNYSAFAASPAGNAFVFETVRQAVRVEGLGKDDTPDVLTINLSSNDYVGHRYGPDSAEVLDISVQTDRQLAEFLRFLAREVPGGLASVTIAVSSDHGVAPVPEESAPQGLPGGRVDGEALIAAIVGALNQQVGQGDWIEAVENDEVYLKNATVESFAAKASREEIEEVVAQAAMGLPFVHYAAGRTAIRKGMIQPTALGRRITAGFHHRRSGDVVLIPEPGFIPGTSGTTHGAPWTYDTHVPLLLAGAGVAPGVYARRVHPAQVAPTLAYLMGSPRPSAADEPLLPGLAGTR